MPAINRLPRIHSGRLERFLTPATIERVQSHMLNGGGRGRRWYGPPINLRDVPGSVWITADGDFYGRFSKGFFASAYDEIEARARRYWREIGRQSRQPMAAAGFASISDALSRASQGFRQFPSGTILKSGPTGALNVTSTLWRVGSSPQAGGAGSAAPGGRATDSSTTGAAPLTNPSSGTLHLTSAVMSATVTNNSLLLYDRIFDVAKTMNSTATEAVTGVPTRYQSTTATAEDYIGGNFLFVEVFTALAATGHNWTVCTYTDQANAASTLPSLTGNVSAIIDRLDHPTFSWFAPLEAGDVGIKALTQMQCSAAVATGAINFVIGHPIGWILFAGVTAGVMYPFSWLTDQDMAPRIFDSACLAALEVNKPSSTATTYSGRIAITNAAP